MVFILARWHGNVNNAASVCAGRKHKTDWLRTVCMVTTFL